MVCAQCGTVANETSRRCLKCDSELSLEPGVTVEVLTGSPAGLSADPLLTRPGPPSSADTLAPGHKFGTRYTVIKKLGAGGMGAVYQAWDESLGTAVALKLIRLDGSTSPEETRQLEARFKRELLLARQITHPNVVRIHDLGELGSTKYLTMAFVDGADLSTVIKREGRFPIPRALAVIRQVAEGLNAAHALGVVHRDLKPANVMLAADDRALLTDFGIARSLDAGTLYTAPGSIIGTLDYMAPEQARGEPADRRSDIYALGLILYEMLAGGRPRAAAGGGLADLLARVEKGPASIESVVPDVPQGLQRVVTRCLDGDPSARYPSAAEFLADVSRLDSEGRLIPAVSARRRPTMAAVAVVPALLLAGVGWWSWTRTAPPPAPAERRAPVSILIADFENRAGDPVFQGSLEQALTLGMEGASFVASYPRTEALRVARAINAGTVLNAEAAQLVAMRQEVPVVLAGSVAQDGASYHLRVEALRPGTNEPFAIAEERASDKAGVLRAIDSIAAELREALGDRPVEGVSRAENVSAATLDALREYTIAQTLSTDRKNAEAIEHYKAAIGYDPAFGRAYAGWAVSAGDLGRRAEAEQLWEKALSLVDRMTEREKYRTLGGYYLAVARNYEKAIENYRELAERYPADLAGHNNLALAYFYTRDFEKAFEYGKLAIDVYPHSLKFRNNYALYAMYAGDFETAAENARQVLNEDPAYEAAYLPLAMAALSDGDVAKAGEVYARARESGPAGASLAALGLADLALYEGKPADAIAVLEPGLAADRASRNTIGESTKSVALAEARASISGADEGVKVVLPLVQPSSDEALLVPAARLFAAAGRESELAAFVARLQERAQPLPRAYAHIISGELALVQRRFSDAIREFSAALKEADLWLARFDLGVAYVEAGRFAEAISELEKAQRRRGEATALFFDDLPTYRYLAVLPYWLGRAQEGLKSPAAAASYEQFLKIRGSAAADPLVEEARQRLQRLSGVSR
jgi:tetratricopeptide (TPR) repeat protein